MEAAIFEKGAQLLRAGPLPHHISGATFQFGSFVVVTAILHVSVILLCCFALGIRDPWKWYMGTSIRAQRRSG